MHVHRITTTEGLYNLTEHWNCLARGVPFRSWQWLLSWWEHYQAEGRLYVLTVCDDRGVLVGVAPWYLARGGPRGRVLRWLGSGHVCSDYLSLLSSVEHEEGVASAIADWLCERAIGASNDRWDFLDLDGIDASDRIVFRLGASLAERGCTAYCRPGPRCWRIDLPNSWDAYLARLSRSHRKQVRRLERRTFQAGRAVLRTAGTTSEVRQGMGILAELHTRRWRSLNQRGCFACPRFSGFLHEAAERLGEAGMLQLNWLELEGRPAAAEFCLVGGDVIYAYQAGLEPDVIAEAPGRLINIATFQKAVEEGRRAFDLLRGDEPYKAHWRALPRPSIRLCAAANRTVSHLRHGVWRAGDAMKQWIKSGLNLAGLHQP